MSTKPLLADSGSDSKIFFEFIHNAAYLLSRDYNHSSQRFQGGIYERPLASQARVALLLYRVTEVQKWILSKKSKTWLKHILRCMLQYTACLL